MAKVAAIVEFAVACGEGDKSAYPVEMAMVQSDSVVVTLSSLFM